MYSVHKKNQNSDKMDSTCTLFIKMRSSDQKDSACTLFIKNHIYDKLNSTCTLCIKMHSYDQMGSTCSLKNITIMTFSCYRITATMKIRAECIYLKKNTALAK